MPFTFSHPAIVLPMKYVPNYHKYFSLTALIVGSIIPDFEYFLRMKMKSTCSHTLEGLLLFDVPIGFVFCFIFHYLIKEELVKHLPDFFKIRFQNFHQLNQSNQLNWYQYCFKNPRNFIIVITSLLIGSFSHLFWDSFTHQTGYFVQEFSISFFKILQHGSTILGGIYILFFIWNLPKSNEINTKNVINTKNLSHLRYWGSVILITAMVFMIRVFQGLDYTAYGHVIVNLISGFLISLMLIPVLKWVIQQHRLLPLR